MLTPEQLGKMKISDMILAIGLSIGVGSLMGGFLIRAGVSDLIIMPLCFAIGFFGPEFILRWLYKPETKQEQSPPSSDNE